MGRIVVSEQISLDGVVDDPSGADGEIVVYASAPLVRMLIDSRLLGSLPHLTFGVVAA